jgi:flagellar protein FliO/FliZ
MAPEYPLQFKVMKSLSPAIIFIFCVSLFFGGQSWSQTPADSENAPLAQSSETHASLPETGMTAGLEPSSYISQIILSLIFILLIIFASAWLLKRFGRVQGVAGEAMKVLSVMSVGQKERIVLMQVGDQQLLVGVTTAKITLLKELETPIEVTTRSSLPSGAFANRLQEALKRTSAKPNKGSGQ